MIRLWSRFTIIFALLTGACNAPATEQAQSAGETQAAPGGAAGDPALEHHPEAPARSETIRDSILLEGTYEPITAQLVKSTGSMSFSTYAPADMRFERSSAQAGEGYYFFANFGGRKNENAFMLVFLLPEGSTDASAHALGKAFVASRKSDRQFSNYQPGSHNGRVFYVAYAYPAEFADGMGPRLAYIRRHWVWLNDGRSLASTLSPRPE